VKLIHKIYGTGQPVIIMHGLFGMGDNWRTIARMLEDQCQSIVVDMRNHGRSPHDPEMNFQVMADDILELMDDLGLDQATLLGHSMGGKVAMHIALHHPDRISRLIVADIAPKLYPPHHTAVIEAISSIDFNSMQDRSDIENTMAAYLGNDQSTIQFLMKNISRDAEGRLEWKANMPVIISAYQHLMETIGETGTFPGPTLFIRGQKSRYIQDEDLPMIAELFPHYRLETIPGAGHWVHADAPTAFAEAVSRFLAE
jgi:esterase